MKVNDVLVRDDVKYRVLAAQENRFLCIDCCMTRMPVWLSGEELAGFTEGSLPAVDKEISAVGMETAHKRFSLIAPLLALLTDDSGRNQALNRVSSESGISKQTIRRYLCRYLVYQDIRCLAPVEKEKSEQLTDDQKNMRRILNRYYYTPAKSSLTDVYVKLLRECYQDETGKLVEGYPSLRQFRYFEKKHRKEENFLISRNGLTNYQRNNRPLLGEGVQDFAPCIGVGMLDATVCDIYLVNREGQVVGRPIMVACVDANTSLCMGYSLLWEGGIYSVRQLMLNLIAGKVDLCRPMGISIEERQWPSTSLPGVMVTDMGSEYTGQTFEQISELGVTLVNLPPYRPDLKGPVEKLFDLIQKRYTDVLQGRGVIMPDFQERGVRDYRKDACLTLEEFERIVVRCIVYYNSERVIHDYPYTKEMLDLPVRPYACDIWSCKYPEAGTNLIDTSVEDITLTLLPRTEGKFTRFGLIANRMRYHCEGYKNSYLKGGTCTVSYDPDDVSKAWVKKPDGSYDEFHLIESRYSGQTLSQATAARDRLAEIEKSEEENALKARMDLMSFIETAAHNAAPPKKADLRGIRETRKREVKRTHKDAGRNIHG